jgi:hypothetical protein
MGWNVANVLDFAKLAKRLNGMRFIVSFAFLLCFAGASAAQDQVSPILDRAIAAIGGSDQLAIQEFRVMYLGRHDSAPFFQSYSPEVTQNSRRQETVVIDVAAHRAVIRDEGVGGDGSPAMWRRYVDADTAYMLNLKTNMKFTRRPQTFWKTSTWRIPHLALRELQENKTRLSPARDRSVRGKKYVALRYQAEDVPAFEVLFDPQSGELGGYQYEARRMTGKTTVSYLFTSYREFARLKRFPAQVVQLSGETPFREFDVIYARSGSASTDKWLTAPPAETRAPTVPGTPTEAMKISEGIYELTNVGGYNALTVDTGSCFAVVDAPASFDSLDILPSPPATSSPAGMIRSLLEKVDANKKICYVIPTHHHDDHFGGIAELAKDGATVIAGPKTKAFAARVLGAKSKAKIQTIDGKLSFDTPNGPMELHLLKDIPHVNEMVFAYFPKQKIVFEGDLADYFVDAKVLTDYLERNHMEVEKFYSVHGRGASTPEEWVSDEPGN